MKHTNQTNEEDSLTEFDHKMIIEMKAIPELEHWSDQQFEQYCLILRWYSKLIVSIVENEKSISPNIEKSVLPMTVISTPLKQAA